MKTNKSTTRRKAMQQIAAMSIGVGLLPFVSFSFTNRTAGKSNTLEALAPFYLPPPETPLKAGPMGIDVRTLIRSAQTNSQFSCVEVYISSMQMGPAPHIHEKLDELMYVKEGTISWMVGEKVYQVRAGGWMFRPHGIIHSFWNSTDKPALAIDMFFHQNLEDYLDILLHQIFPDMIKNHLTPADPGIASKMKKLNKKFGVTMFPEKRQAIIDKYGLKP